MKSYNNITLVGRSVRDCEYKDMVETKRAVFTLAVDRPKGEDGKLSTDFISVVAYGKLAEICGDYITKGSLILATGRLQSRSYEVDREIKWITEVIADGINVLEYKSTTVKQKATA